MSAEPSPKPLVFPSRPIPAKARLRVDPVAVPEYLPARMLNEFVYCPRLFFYEWVDGIFRHSSDTIDGAQRHEKADAREDALPAAEALSDVAFRAKGITLSSDRHRLIAKLDMIEAAAGQVTPVDYKRGAPMVTDGEPEAWPADVAQVVAQAIVLRDNGYDVTDGLVYYYETKQRVRISITDALVAQTTATLEAARTVAQSGRIPLPLEDSPKCHGCSLSPICLPDETRAVLRDEASAVPEQPALFDIDDHAQPRETTEPRRLSPTRDDQRPLYVTGYALTVHKSGGVLQIKEKGQLVQEARVNDLNQVNLFGPVTITGGAVHALCEAEIPVAHFSMGGWFTGLTRGLGLKNVHLRRMQFRAADDDWTCLRLARGLVATKIRNQRTLLQRNHVEPPPRSLDLLKRMGTRATAAQSLEELLGIEGTAAAAYFSQFAGMIKVDDDQVQVFDFRTRNRRPPRDPVNALLSFVYSLLARDLTIVCHAVGVDPFVGFFHQMRCGRPALALDLMEGFRPLIADSAVLMALNTGMVTGRDFVRAGGGVGLNQRGRSAVIRAYEQRMDQLVTHPVFGYRISYRRVLDVQARLLARYLEGEISSYPGFETR